MNDIMSEESFNNVKESLDLLRGEVDNVLSMFNNDIHSYMANNNSPFNLYFNQNDMLDFVDKNYVELCGQVSKIFKNDAVLENMKDDFLKFYTTLNQLYENGFNNPEDKTIAIALLLICIEHNNNDAQTIRKIEVVLKSMCVQPTVGTLVQVSSYVLDDYKI